MKTACLLIASAAIAFPAAANALGNPASEFCLMMGGRSVLASTADGEVGLCYLPGRKIVEEWTLFRMFNGRVPAPGRNPLR